MENKEKKCWCGGQLQNSVHPMYGQCVSCGTLVLKNCPSPEELKNFYGFDNYWHDYMTSVSRYPPIEDRAKDDFENRIPVWYDLVKKNKPEVESLLEIGCAHGGFLFHCRQNGVKNVVGVEPDEKTCKFARKTFNLPHVVSGLFPEVELPLKKFDVIAGFDVAEHFPDPMRAFKEVANLLKDDGIFIFQTPCYYGEDNRWVQFRPAEHLYLYNQNSIKKLFEASGLEIKKILPGYFPDDIFVLGCRKAACSRNYLGLDSGSRKISEIAQAPQTQNFNTLNKNINQAEQIKKILITRPDSIGDIVIFSGILKYFREIFPEASISILVKKHIVELLEKCPYIDKVITFTRNSLFTDEVYTQDLLQQLRSENFDVAINPVYSRDKTGDFLTLNSGAKTTIASFGDNSNISVDEKSSNDRLYTKLIPASVLPMMETRRNEEFIRGLGIELNEPIKPQVWITDEDRIAAQRLLSDSNIERPIVISPFGQYSIRNWPVYKWAALINNYEDKPVLICGSEQDYKTGQQIIELARHKRVYNLCGKTSLRQLAAVLERSCLCIGAESAAGHIAAAVGCPNVIIVGGGHFGRFVPYSPMTSVVCLPLECYGCNWQCRYQRAHCIEDIRPRVVAEAVRKTLEKQSDKPRVFVQDTLLWKAETGEPEWKMCEKFVDTNSVKIIHVSQTTPAQVKIPSGTGQAKQKSIGLTIATSIAPKEITKQARAVGSWHKLGFDVVSINCREETEILQEYFPDVHFIQAKRDAKNILGKPFIYFDDILEYFRQADCDICGIVNSDIYLSGDENIVLFIRSEAKNSLVYGARIEVDSLENLSGEVYENGFDFFFFDKSIMSHFPRSDFCIGATWWDYWMPLVPVLANCPVKKLVSPFAYHLRHLYKWDEKQWFLLGGKLYGYLRERICEKIASNSLTGRWDLLARMLSTYAHFFTKKAESIRNKDEYTNILYQSSGPCILEFLEIESQLIDQAGRQREKTANAADYIDMNITIGISFEDYQKAVELNQYGEYLLNKGDNEGARNVFTEAARILPNFTAVYNNIGILHLRKDQPADALKYFIKALKIDQVYVPGIINSAGVLVRSGQIQAARSLVLNSAKKLLDRGKPAKAAEIYKAYLWENAGDGEIIKVLGNLCTIESVETAAQTEHIPIVFIHIGDSDCLKYALAQARLTNPRSKIYLIGDQANDKYDFVEHHDYKKCCRSAQRFERVYKHLSPNSFCFELMCFLRWFVLRDFLKSMNIRGCVSLDSDVMVYTDLSIQWRRFAHFGMTVSGGSCPNCNFISDVDLLDEFCEYLIRSYTDPISLRQLEDFFEPRRGKGLPGVSDMTFFDKFRQKYPDRIAEISEIAYGSKFDLNINVAEDFETERGRKKIYWASGKPQCRLIATGGLVTFNNLHFQGNAKETIKDYFTGKLQLSSDGKKWSVKEDGNTAHLKPAGRDTTIESCVDASLPNRSENQYLVTAIVSTYNAGKFIGDCLDDLENQTIADRLEIIVVNSGSLENEEEFIKEFQQRYGNIKYIKTEQRETIYQAWNRAVAAAQGKYLTSANTDDRHRKDALEIIAKSLDAEPQTALVYGDQIVTQTQNDTFENNHGTEQAQRPDFSRERLLFGCCVGSQPMWRKRLHDEFGYFDEKLTGAGDWDFWLRVSTKYMFKHIPQYLGLYYHNERGIEHGKKIHSLYERYLVGKRYGNPYISVIPVYQHRDNSLVSVIMPAHNAEKFVASAIESVLIQNYRNFELIVVDDGSTDNTKQIVAGFEDEKVKYFYKENGGPSTARNFGIQKASGAFTVPLDADDMMMPDFISRHLQEFEKCPQADLIYCDDCLMDEDDQPIRVIKRPVYDNQRNLIGDLFRCGFPVVPFRTCIRKEVFEKIGLYDEKLLVAEDYDMIRRFIKAGLTARHLDGILYLRRINPKSLTRQYSVEKATAHFEVMRRFMSGFGHDELFPLVRWEEIEPAKRQLHFRILSALVYLSVGQTYVDSKAPLFARSAYEMACSQLKKCLIKDAGNERVRFLLDKCRLELNKVDIQEEKPERQLCNSQAAL